MVVFCTAPPDSSGRLARTIVGERLAACVNITQVRSKVEALAARIREVHPYELPEIIVLPISGGDEGYLNWLSESVRDGSRPDE